jgi:hypothetical protein
MMMSLEVSLVGNQYLLVNSRRLFGGSDDLQDGVDEFLAVS